MLKPFEFTTATDALKWTVVGRAEVSGFRLLPLYFRDAVFLLHIMLTVLRANFVGVRACVTRRMKLSSRGHRLNVSDFT